MQKTTRKIFVGPCEIAGFSSNLSYGLKQIGENIRFMDLWGHAFDYGGCDNGFLENRLQNFKSSYYKCTKKKPILKIVLGVFNIIFTNVHFIKALFVYDVFIFIFGYSLLPLNIDLPILRLFRKKVIFNIALGSEARPPYMNGVYQSKDGIEKYNLATIYTLTRKIRKRVARIEQWSSLVIGSPFSTSQFATKKFINYFSLGFPRKNMSAENNGSEMKSCRILHSPSHPAAKGSDLINEAVKKLEEQGYDLEFVQLQNKTNSEVLNELKDCDFIVDQLYSDTPLAGFACEAAAFGKPAVVGSYAVDLFGKYIPADMMPPSILCAPEKIQEEIKKMVKNNEYRKEIGLEARKFVESKWSSEAVAERYSQLIKGTFPEGYWFDPDTIEYFYGTGQSELRTKDIVNRLIGTYGSGALCLDHKTGLKQKLIEFSVTAID